VILLGGAFALLWFVLMPSTAPDWRHPSFWDALVDSRFMIGIVRFVGMAVGLVAAAYLVASMVGLMSSKRWLSVLGPFRADADTRQSVTSTVQERDNLVEQLSKAQETIETQEQTIRELRSGLQSVMASLSGQASDSIQEGAS
jgi:hypothetical protein